MNAADLAALLAAGAQLTQLITRIAADAANNDPTLWSTVNADYSAAVKAWNDSTVPLPAPAPKS